MGDDIYTHYECIQNHCTVHLKMVKIANFTTLFFLKKDKEHLNQSVGYKDKKEAMNVRNFFRDKI